jgi:phosphohistidine phosphatase
VKTIYLLRHAKSSWDDPELADIDRPLAKRGKKARKAIARHLLKKDMRPALILCSPAKRARSTLKSVRAALDADAAVQIDDGLYGGDAGALLRRIHELDDRFPR